MTSMHGTARYHRSRLARLALLLAAVAQVAVSFLAPAAEARLDRDLRAHVEAAGTRLHHAHAETLCPACSAQHLTSVPPASPAPAPTTRHSRSPADTEGTATAPGGFDAHAPRAPPLSL